VASVCVLALSMTAFGAACAAAINPLRIEAAQTEARVKTALVNDPILGTRVIHVQMVGGVAQLSGRVRSADEAARAADIARRVAGVTDVDLRIQIGAEPPQDGTVAGRRGDPSRGPAYEFAELEHEPNLLAVGAGLGLANQQGPAAGVRAALQPIVRLGAGAGLGPAVAFEWFEARAASATDSRLDGGGIRVRPIMAGIRYTLPIGRLAIAPSLVAGYAFNSIRVPDHGDAAGVPVGVDNSFVWRPAVGLWLDSGRRTLVHASVGRVLTSPGTTVIENGALRKRTVSADTTVVLVGVAYRWF
jgi:hypothetical protein